MILELCREGKGPQRPQKPSASNHIILDLFPAGKKKRAILWQENKFSGPGLFLEGNLLYNETTEKSSFPSDPAGERGKFSIERRCPLLTPNHVKLNICGTDYYLTSTQSEEYFRTLAQRMERDINEYTSPRYGLSMSRATVLVALSYLDELEKAETTVENMRRQLKDYLEDAARAQLGLREAREEAARLKKENEELNRKLNLALQRLEKGKV